MTEKIPSPDELRALADELEDDEEDERVNDLVEILSPYDSACSLHQISTDEKYIFAVESTDEFYSIKYTHSVRKSDDFEIGGVQWDEELEFADSGIEIIIYDMEVYDD
jgi:hypothetical protein